MGVAPDGQSWAPQAPESPPPQAEGPLEGPTPLRMVANLSTEVWVPEDRWGAVFYANMNGDRERSLGWDALPPALHDSVTAGANAVVREAMLEHDTLVTALMSDVYPCPGNHCAHSRDDECDDQEPDLVIDPSNMEGQITLRKPCPSYREACPEQITVYLEWDGDGESKSYSYPVAEGACSALIEFINEDYDHPFWGPYAERLRLRKLLVGAREIS